MKANELRIGNYLYDDLDDTIMIVSRTETKDYTEWNTGNKYNICCLKKGTEQSYYEGDFRPIPLTEEILLKCVTKFKGINHRSEILIQGQCFEFFVNENDFYLQFTGGEGVSFSVPIKYLHSLQNIFHALTNEELIVNL